MCCINILEQNEELDIITENISSVNFNYVRKYQVKCLWFKLD